MVLISAPGQESSSLILLILIISDQISRSVVSDSLRPHESQHAIDAFELWCWRRLLRVPWTARRSNQSIDYIAWFKLKPPLQFANLNLVISVDGNSWKG